MIREPYRDVLLGFDYGGFYDKNSSSSDKEKINVSKYDGVSSANLKFVLNNYKKYRKKGKENIKIILPPDTRRIPQAHTENSVSQIESLEVSTIEVEKNNTLTMRKLKQQKIRQVQFLHSLAKDKVEFEYLFSKFWNSVLHSKIELDEFGLYVLGLREIYFLTKNEKYNIKNIENLNELKSLYFQNCKYLIFSQDQNWRSFILSHINVPSIATSNNCKDYILNKFSDNEIRQLLIVNLPNLNMYYDKTLQWIKNVGSLLYVLDLVKSYHKNKDLFLSYDIDFNTFKVNNKISLETFENNIRNLNVYKILSKLLQRLDSSKRQEIKNHKYLFEDYFNICKDIYFRELPFDRIEPVLRKLHTYKDASYLYNALKSIIADDNLYHLYEKAEKTKGAKVVFFDENEQILLVRIKKSKALDTLGSRVWCIYGNRAAFFRYTSPFRRFYIYYDAKQNQLEDTRNPIYMIGFTISLFNNIVYAHNQRDSNLKGSDYCETVFKKYKKFFRR